MLEFCSQAWKEVSPETISNCFFKSGTLEQVDPIKDAENKQEFQDYSTKINRILSKEIEDLTTLIAKFKTTSEKIEAKEYITIDDNTSGKCDEDDNCEDGSDDEKESDDEAVENEKISTSEGLQALQISYRFIQHQQWGDEKTCDILRNAISKTLQDLQQNSVQTTITSYYKKENIIQTSPASFSAAFGSSSATSSPASRSTPK